VREIVLYNVKAIRAITLVANGIMNALFSFYLVANLNTLVLGVKPAIADILKALIAQKFLLTSSSLSKDGFKLSITDCCCEILASNDDISACNVFFCDINLVNYK